MSNNYEDIRKILQREIEDPMLSSEALRSLAKMRDDLAEAFGVIEKRDETIKQINIDNNKLRTEARRVVTRKRELDARRDQLNQRAEEMHKREIETARVEARGEAAFELVGNLTRNVEYRREMYGHTNDYSDNIANTSETVTTTAE